MKVIVILDQIQAGLGGKERADLPLGGKKLALGSAETLAKLLATNNDKIIGTFYCGTDYYQEHRELVQEKFAKMAKKMGADVVLVGPTYDYAEFTQMACEFAAHIQATTSLPVLVASAIEKNQETIEQYQNDLTLVKMPKKGGTGLSAALNHFISGGQLAAAHEDLTQFKHDYCYGGAS